MDPRATWCVLIHGGESDVLSRTLDGPHACYGRVYYTHATCSYFIATTANEGLLCGTLMSLMMSTHLATLVLLSECPQPFLNFLLRPDQSQPLINRSNGWDLIWMFFHYAMSFFVFFFLFNDCHVLPPKRPKCPWLNGVVLFYQNQFFKSIYNYAWAIFPQFFCIPSYAIKQSFHSIKQQHFERQHLWELWVFRVRKSEKESPIWGWFLTRFSRIKKGKF